MKRTKNRAVFVIHKLYQTHDVCHLQANHKVVTIQRVLHTKTIMKKIEKCSYPVTHQTRIISLLSTGLRLRTLLSEEDIFMVCTVEKIFHRYIDFYT